MHNNILNLQRKEEAQKHLQSVFNVFIKNKSPLYVHDSETGKNPE